MKTIRQNCFETNSSSTHSVTIVRKGDLKEPKNNPLVANGVLDPAELCNTSAYREMSYGDGGHSLCATTKDQKAALFVDHIFSRVEYDYEEVIIEKIKAILKEELIRLCGYTDIRLDFSAQFSAYSENGDCYIDEILSDDGEDLDETEFRGMVVKHITEVVLNDDAIVIDEDVPY